MPDKPEVVILAGGFGNRFRVPESTVEKPLIEVFGIPQIAWAILGAIRSYPGANIFVAARSGLIDDLKRDLSTRLPDVVHEFVDIGSSTRGPAHSLSLFVKNAKKLNLLKRIVACDNDCLSYINNPLIPNFISVTESSNPQHCFITADGEGRVIQLHEKTLVGSVALSGNYGFQSSLYFLEMYKTTIFDNNEEYLSDVITHLLAQGAGVIQVKCLEYFSLGTPAEIEAVSKRLLDYKSECSH
jgi:NDP-sugar pyrophosphorylase family protein